MKIELFIKTMTDIITKNENETRKMAKIFAKEIIRKPLNKKSALVIGLEGELGAGKTTFIQAFAKGMKIKNRITSPSFVLIKRYKIPYKPISNFQQPISNLYHIDCYRIKSYKDILTLDFQEIVLNPKNIVLIEWAERIKKIIPKDAIWIEFKIISEKERRITIKPKCQSSNAK